MRRPGPIGRLGRFTARHVRLVVAFWVVIAVGLGVFAPKVETALSGAGWQANGSESVQARAVIERDFGGLSSSALMVVLHSSRHRFGDPSFNRALARVTQTLRSSGAVATVVTPRRGVSVSRDGHTAIVQAGARRDPTGMVAAADRLKRRLAAAGGAGIEVSMTGASGMWSDFNTANRTAMMKSELLAWPVTLAILVLAFGSLVAAGLPLMLTIVGLVAAAGSLYLGSRISEISIWAMNFALMFALALGIDYALFIVSRFRGALFGSKLSVEEAVEVAMDTAGKAVLFSGLTVLVSLSAVMLVPSPAFRSMALGIMLSVVFVLAATLTLLPAALAQLGPRIDRLGLRWVHAGEHRSRRFAGWAERLWRHPILFGGAALVVLVALALPVFGLKTGMPSIKVVPAHDSSRVGYTQVQAAFGAGAPGALQIVASSADAGRAAAVVRGDAGIARVQPPQPGRGGRVLLTAIPRND
ncbi:MAG: MMPL family transporter, partial [Gaiellaceae bacterium]